MDGAAHRGEKDTGSDINIYGRTKLANFMTNFEFNRRLVGSGVESFACQPGIASTDLYNKAKIDDDKVSAKVSKPALAPSQGEIRNRARSGM